MGKQDRLGVNDEDIDDRSDWLSLKLLIILNWAFAVFSFIALVLLIILQLGVSFFVSSSENAQVAPPEVIALGFAYVIPAFITALLGIEGFQRGSDRILNVHIVFNILFSLMTVIGCGLLIPTFQGNALNSIYDGFIQQFNDYYNELSGNQREGWEDVQNSFGCCATNAESLVEFGRARQMTGSACSEFTSDPTFINFFTDNEDNVTAFLLGIEDFNIPFCEDKLLEFLETLVPLFVALLVLNVLSILSQFILFAQWQMPLSEEDEETRRRVSYDEEQDYEILIRPTSKKVSSREDDLLETSAIKQTKSLAPELKDIYSSNWKMSKKGKVKKTKDQILEDHLKDFEEEEKNASLKKIDLVKADLPRNQPKRVSLLRFPGKREDDLVSDINRKETSETLGRVQFETLNTYLVSEDDSEEEQAKLGDDEGDGDVSFL